MYNHISSTVVKSARKIHTCTACEHIKDRVEEYPSFMDRMSETQKEWTKDRFRKDWKIQIGESYNISIGTYDGEIFRSKYLPIAHQICTQYELYPDWD